MTEIPTTLLEAVEFFADPLVCNQFMRDVKWPRGKVICPKCGHDRVSDVKGRPNLQCGKCRKQFSYKVGTIFEDSPLPLQKWFVAIWYLVNCRNGISSHELGRAIGVSQRTAWFMTQRIRKALEQNSFRKLDGEVESDETFVGGAAANMHERKRAKRITGRGAVGKTAVQGLLQRDGEVRTFVCGNLSGGTIRENVLSHVARDSALYTDSATVYEGMANSFRHDSVDHAAKEFVLGEVHTNGIENFWSLLKRMLGGTYIAVAPFHLFRYCHEQAFRFDWREFTDARRFLEVMRGVVGKRLTYRQLAAVSDCGFMGIK